MVSVLWTSVGSIGRSSEWQTAEKEALPITELETLFQRWQDAPNQCDFISALPLDQARALADLILDRVPPHTPTKHTLQRKQKQAR